MFKISSTFSKVLLATLLGNIVAIVWLGLTKNMELLPYAIYFFLFLWGVDKFKEWLIKEDIRVGAELKIKKNAPPYIRAIGLLLSLSLIIYGATNFIIELIS